MISGGRNVSKNKDESKRQVAIRNVISNTVCVAGGLSSIACGAYLLYWTLTAYTGYTKINVETIYSVFLCKGFPAWFDRERIMSVTELTLVSAGLILAYSILIHNIRTYFADHMILEMRSLTALFASFMVAYCLRCIY